MDDVMPWMPLAIVLSGAVAGAVVWALTFLPLRKPGAQAVPLRFLLRDGLVTDHTAGASCDVIAGQSGWADLRAWLGARFPGLPEHLADVKPGQSLRIPAARPDDTSHVEITGLRRGRHRLELNDPEPLATQHRHQMTLQVMQDAIRRTALEAAPCGICIIDQTGKPDWHNAQFRSFTDDQTKQIATAATSTDQSATVTITDSDTAKNRHFNIMSETAGDSRVLYATEVTQLVEADTMRSSFIQTLTKTFADLAIGLVVFDRRQRLVLFNPAIIDLTGLPAEFLSIRPGVMEFFDRLRDRQVLPEPKNYASWRAQIGDMIDTAVDGHYSEAWTLPNGLTYRVTGRPHPDGAIAFLFEDITDAVSTSRRSRTQLEIRQAAFDQISDVVAVVGPNGFLVFCNSAFRDLLGFDPDNSFAETGWNDLVALCRDRFPDKAFWDSVLAGQGRTRAEAHLAKGPFGPVLGRVQPLTGGFTMIQFTPVTAKEPVSA